MEQNESCRRELQFPPAALLTAADIGALILIHAVDIDKAGILLAFPGRVALPHAVTVTTEST
jgi:hypothetical protein